MVPQRFTWPHLHLTSLSEQFRDQQETASEFEQIFGARIIQVKPESAKWNQIHFLALLDHLVGVIDTTI